MIGRIRPPVAKSLVLVLAWVYPASGCESDSGSTTAAAGTSASGGPSSLTRGGSTNAAGGLTNAAGTTRAGGTAGGTEGGTTSHGGSGGADGSGASDCRVWVATDGDDANPGTEALPVVTLAKGYDLLCPPPPSGTPNGAECLGPAPRTLCIKPGTYPMTERLELRKTRMGTETQRITLQGDPRSTTKPVLDFTGQPRVLTCGAASDSSGGELTGITMNADFTVLRDLEIQNANDNCVKVQGANNLVERVVVHGCADVGIQISSGSGYTASGTGNTLLNCDSYQNNDSQCFGLGADGFAVKVGTGAGNVFRGCRAWDNANDGFDLGAWTSPVVLDNSWAIQQATTTLGTNSHGDGFKLGANGIITLHGLSDLIAVGNANGTSGYGFNENTNSAALTCTGTCAAWGNRTEVGAIGGVSTAPIAGVTGEKMIAAPRNADGSLPALSSL